MYTTLQTGILLLSILNQFRLGPSVPHSHTEMDTMGSYALALLWLWAFLNVISQMTDKLKVGFLFNKD